MDLIRQKSIFDPDKITGSVAVVGVGALGSAVALMLAKLGLKNLVLFDDDDVESHNLCNQVLYGPDDIGYAKTVSASNRIYAMTGIWPTAPSVKLETKHQLRDMEATHVFVCVDSMQARKDIFDKCVYLNPQIVFFAEGRLSSRGDTSAAPVPALAPTSVPSVGGNAIASGEKVKFTLAGHAKAGTIEVASGTTVGEAMKSMGVLEAPSSMNLRSGDNKVVGSSTKIESAMTVSATSKRSGG